MALITTAPINAVVAHIMDEKHGEYGPYQSVLFESAELEHGKLWRSLKPQEAQSLHKGQTVALTPVIKKGKESWNIRPLAASAQPQPTKPPASQSQAQSQLTQQVAVSPTPQPNTPAPPTAAKRREQIEAYAFSMANLHAVCYQAAEQAYAGQNAPDEVIRAATSSVFISTERRFRLASPGS